MLACCDIIFLSGDALLLEKAIPGKQSISANGVETSLYVRMG